MPIPIHQTNDDTHFYFLFIYLLYLQYPPFKLTKDRIKQLEVQVDFELSEISCACARLSFPSHCGLSRLSIRARNSLHQYFGTSLNYFIDSHRQREILININVHVYKSELRALEINVLYTNLALLRYGLRDMRVVPCNSKAVSAA